ncbi:MFS transporter [Pseudonocardia acaciae]|uniref:MFS transporter n=1 Tax=Pseudonocardia acaciae TaxID=551276 RepID=UPI00055F0E8A|nr:MFS transporter [Pseudonocardia acaciae]
MSWNIRQWLGLALLLVPTALMTVDLGVLWLATPYLTEDLRPSSSQLLWITDIYGFMTAGLLVVMGTLGDRIGRRRLLVIGAGLFVVASVAAAYAGSAEQLIAARAVLGAAGAAVLPSTLSLISHMFTDARQRATAIAMWVTALSVGLAIGPIIGGLLLASFWWGSTFLIGAPVMLVAMVAAPWLLPEYRDPDAGRLDAASVVLFLLGILPVVYAVKRVAEHGVDWPVPAALVAGGVFGALFVRRQRRLASPLLDVRLLADRTTAAALGTLLLGMMALNGVEYLVPQYLQQVGGLSPLAAGLWLLPGAAGLVAGSQLTPPLTRRFRPAHVIAAGVLVSVVGYGLTMLAGRGGPGVVLAAAGLTVMMFGVAPISVLGTALAVGAAPPERAGSAAATGQTAYDLGLALGIAATGSVAVGVYRTHLTAALPAGVPVETADTARSTLGGAAAAARGLPPDVGGRLLDAAGQAFVSGFHAAAAVSAVIALAVAGLVLARLRHIGPTPKAPAASEELSRH